MGRRFESGQELMKKPIEKLRGFGVLWLLCYRGKMSEKYGFGDYLGTIEKVVPKLHFKTGSRRHQAQPEERCS